MLFTPNNNQTMHDSRILFDKVKKVNGKSAAIYSLMPNAWMFMFR